MDVEKKNMPRDGGTHRPSARHPRKEGGGRNHWSWLGRMVPRRLRLKEEPGAFVAWEATFLTVHCRAGRGHLQCPAQARHRLSYARKTMRRTLPTRPSCILRPTRTCIRRHVRNGKRAPICAALAACNAAGIHYVEENDFMRTYEKLYRWLIKTKFPFRHGRIYPYIENDSCQHLDEPGEILEHVSLPQGCRFGSHPTRGGYLGSNSELVVLDNSSMKRLKSRLVLDGTPGSYWETTVLLFLSPQIEMVWHGLYETCDMVFDLRKFFAKGRFFGLSGRFVYDRMSPDHRQKLLGMDFVPTVTLAKKGANVFFTAFSPFKGFKRVRLSIIPREVGFSFRETILDEIPFRIPLHF